jgi:hypothetical protein
MKRERIETNNYKKFWEELIAYFPLIRHGPHRKRRLQQFFVAAGKSLPSRCLATKGGIHFTEPLPNNGGRDTHTDTQIDGRDL